MAKIVFPCTNRVHLARQKLLIYELSKDFEVIVSTGEHFEDHLKAEKPDLVLIRGDRMELLPLATQAFYDDVPIAHIEGGDLSGVKDNRVRHAITQLADIHFATNKESYARLIRMGTDPEMTFDYGSLDVEYAKSIGPTILNGKRIYSSSALVCFHPFPEENGYVIKDEFFRGSQLIYIRSNSDYGLQNHGEEYNPENYIRKLADARLLVGNSSSFLKEASIFGTPVVNVGTRQQNRLIPRNVMSVPHNQDAVKMAIDYQLKHGRYRPDMVYYKPDTSKNISKKLCEILL